MSSGSGGGGSASSRRVKFDRSAEKSTAASGSTNSQLPPAAGHLGRSRGGGGGGGYREQLMNVGHCQVATDLPSGIRTFLGEEPAIMMPVPLSWSSQDGGEQKYFQDMRATIPEFLQRDLDFDFADCAESKGTPCRFCGMEFGPAALLNHQAKCKKEVEAANNDATRGAEPGYLIRNWYSRGHPLKRLEKNKHMKECRYCHALVAWNVVSQHEDECRSVLYGTTPTSGYY